MRASWFGTFLCFVVIYFGIVHSLSSPMILLNAHAVILVLGGTVAIGFLTYSPEALSHMMNFVIYGFWFRMKKTDRVVARELISEIDAFYRQPSPYVRQQEAHPFLREALHLLYRQDISPSQMAEILMDRRNAIKRRYMEDARMLNNIAKYPPHLGLLGAASGMIEMMTGLGQVGIDSIGAAMATALSATLWGVGLNNFVFLPLSDNSNKASEDEIHLRDMIIDCTVRMKKKESYRKVIRTCYNRLSLHDRFQITNELLESHFDEDDDVTENYRVG